MKLVAELEHADMIALMLSIERSSLSSKTFSASLARNYRRDIRVLFEKVISDCNLRLDFYFNLFMQAYRRSKTEAVGK